jgi:hypothetical protein
VDNRDKITSKVAKLLGLIIHKVEQVVSVPFDMAHKAIMQKTQRSIYIRNVGTFIPYDVRGEIIKSKHATWEEKKNKTQQDEDPISF